jgi:hypothetical protein
LFLTGPGQVLKEGSKLGNIPPRLLSNEMRVPSFTEEGVDGLSFWQKNHP